MVSGQAEGTRRSRVMVCPLGFRPGGVGDGDFAVADDVLAGDRLELTGEVADAAALVDPGFVVSGPEVAESGVRV
jgi:hypothetical protein